LFKAVAALITGGRYTNDQAFCVCVNVSRHGVGLRTGQPPGVGQTVVLRLAIDEEIHSLLAVTKQVTKTGPDWYHVGLDFGACTSQDLQFLDRYVAGSAAVH
jgi:hypothetical protein